MILRGISINELLQHILMNGDCNELKLVDIYLFCWIHKLNPLEKENVFQTRTKSMFHKVWVKYETNFTQPILICE